jgi:hypothetical protein
MNTQTLTFALGLHTAAFKVCLFEQRTATLCPHILWRRRILLIRRKFAYALIEQLIPGQLFNSFRKCMETNVRLSRAAREEISDESGIPA